MDFSGLRQRKKEKQTDGSDLTTIYHGKSIANKAPAMFLIILDNKLKQHGAKLHRINTWTVKASQYNHVEDSYTKKNLNQRWNHINGRKVQRDLYSAFLIMNVNDDLNSIDIEKCHDRYDNFLKLHDLEVQRLSGKKNLSSVGI